MLQPYPHSYEQSNCTTCNYGDIDPYKMQCNEACNKINKVVDQLIKGELGTNVDVPAPIKIAQKKMHNYPDDQLSKEYDQRGTQYIGDPQSVEVFSDFPLKKCKIGIKQAQQEQTGHYIHRIFDVAVGGIPGALKADSTTHEDGVF